MEKREWFTFQGKQCGYHEKHQAWVICRCPGQVSLTGGSHFESQHFKTRKELESFLMERESKLGKLITGAASND